MIHWQDFLAAISPSSHGGFSLDYEGTHYSQAWGTVEPDLFEPPVEPIADWVVSNPDHATVVNGIYNQWWESRNVNAYWSPGQVPDRNLLLVLDFSDVPNWTTGVWTEDGDGTVSSASVPVVDVYMESEDWNTGAPIFFPAAPSWPGHINPFDPGNPAIRVGPPASGWGTGPVVVVPLFYSAYMGPVVGHFFATMTLACDNPGLNPLVKTYVCFPGGGEPVSLEMAYPEPTMDIQRGGDGISRFRRGF